MLARARQLQLTLGGRPHGGPSASLHFDDLFKDTEPSRRPQAMLIVDDLFPRARGEERNDDQFSVGSAEATKDSMVANRIGKGFEPSADQHSLKADQGVGAMRNDTEKAAHCCGIDLRWSNPANANFVCRTAEASGKMPQDEAVRSAERHAVRAARRLSFCGARQGGSENSDECELDSH